MKKIILKIIFAILKHNKYDVNFDGEVNSKDILELKKYLIEKESDK